VPLTRCNSSLAARPLFGNDRAIRDLGRAYDFAAIIGREHTMLPDIRSPARRITAFIPVRSAAPAGPGLED